MFHHNTSTENMKHGKVLTIVLVGSEKNNAIALKAVPINVFILTMDKMTTLNVETDAYSDEGTDHMTLLRLSAHCFGLTSRNFIVLVHCNF